MQYKKHKTFVYLKINYMYGDHIVTTKLVGSNVKEITKFTNKMVEWMSARNDPGGKRK